MTTLILPCAGQSTRFPRVAPKWMLTHPSGQIMVRAGLRSFELSDFQLVLAIVTAQQVSEWDAELVLNQAFSDVANFRVTVLPDRTAGPLDTVLQAISAEGIDGPIVVKDSDNHVNLARETRFFGSNFVVGVNINDVAVADPFNKSYILANQQGLVMDIVEKKVVSETLCAGVYGFASAETVHDLGTELLSASPVSRPEVFLSHVIAHMILSYQQAFAYLPADDYEDWGTSKEWGLLKEREQTIFVDFDGVLMKNCGRYGRRNWSNSSEELLGNLERIQELAGKGAQIVITTSRPAEYVESIENVLARYGIQAHAIVTNLNHARRVLVNDFAASNPFPSALGISMPRDGLLEDYL